MSVEPTCRGPGSAGKLAAAMKISFAAVAGRRDEEGAETVRLVEAGGGEATFVPTDVTREGDVTALMEGRHPGQRHRAGAVHVGHGQVLLRGAERHPARRSHCPSRSGPCRPAEGL